MAGRDGAGAFAAQSSIAVPHGLHDALDAAREHAGSEGATLRPTHASTDALLDAAASDDVEAARCASQEAEACVRRGVHWRERSAP
jgi:hypothetical protein